MYMNNVGALRLPRGRRLRQHRDVPSPRHEPVGAVVLRGSHFLTLLV